MIGGNTTATLQVLKTTKNEIGETVKSYVDLFDIWGWLDYQSGESKYSSYNFKLQESTHIFVSDYVEIDYDEEKLHLVCDDKHYDVLLVDDPMNLHYQTEIYLKYTGRQR